jgi:hypothetical protein
MDKSCVSGSIYVIWGISPTFPIKNRYRQGLITSWKEIYYQKRVFYYQKSKYIIKIQILLSNRIEKNRPQIWTTVPVPLAPPGSPHIPPDPPHTHTKKGPPASTSRRTLHQIAL